MKIIDCTGLLCPQPVINTKKYFDSIEHGEGEIIVDNEIAKENITKYASSNNFKYELLDENGIYKIKIKKEKTLQKNKSDNLVVMITSDKLGDGSAELGETLMKSYIYALSEGDTIPKTIVFLNSGVKLAATNSNSLESLKRLIERGTEILSCGICVEYYNLKGKIEVGDISNMYTIVEKTNEASNTIKI